MNIFERLNENIDDLKAYFGQNKKNYIWLFNKTYLKFKLKKKIVFLNDVKLNDI